MQRTENRNGRIRGRVHRHLGLALAHRRIHQRVLRLLIEQRRLLTALVLLHLILEQLRELQVTCWRLRLHGRLVDRHRPQLVVDVRGLVAPGGRDVDRRVLSASSHWRRAQGLHVAQLVDVAAAAALQSDDARVASIAAGAAPSRVATIGRIQAHDLVEVRIRILHLDLVVGEVLELRCR